MKSNTKLIPCVLIIWKLRGKVVLKNQTTNQKQTKQNPLNLSVKPLQICDFISLVQQLEQ